MKKYFTFYIILFITQVSISQENISIFTNYLTDNNYLIHPAVSGIETKDKFRISVRKQWFNVKDSPNLQILDGFIHFSEVNSLGISIFKDQNGYFSNTGGKLSYTYQVESGLYRQYKLAFSLATSWFQYDLDTKKFNTEDPLLDKKKYTSNRFNLDASLAFRSNRMFVFYTLQDLLPVKGKTLEKQFNTTVNYRHHILTLGYFVTESKEHQSKIQISVMGQYFENNNQTSIDSNLKFFVPLSENELWAGLSYRTELGNPYDNANYISFFMGFSLRQKYMISYHYTHQMNKLIYTSSGFHQIGLGINLDHEHKQESFFEM